MAPARILGIVLLVIGIALLFFGMQQAESPADQIAETFTGSPTQETMWYLIGGAAAAIAGLLLTVFGKR